jgi:hypothetical protein
VHAARHAVLRSLYAASPKARARPFKVVITAVMRKMLLILNGILRAGEPWKHAKAA